MAVIRVPVARPVGGSAIADALRAVGQLGYQYDENKRYQKELEQEQADRADRKKLRALQTQKAQLDIDKYRRETAEETALMEGVENVEQAQEQRAKLDEILKQVNAQPLQMMVPGPNLEIPPELQDPNAPLNLTDQDLGIGPDGAPLPEQPPPGPQYTPVDIQRTPEGMVRTPSLEALLSDELKEKTTIPGMESVGVPSREVSPTRMALDRLRAEQRQREAERAEEHPPIGFPDDESVPEVFRGKTFRYGDPGYEMAKRASQDYATSLFREEKAPSLRGVWDSTNKRYAFATDEQIAASNGALQPTSAAPKGREKDVSDWKDNKYLRTSKFQEDKLTSEYTQEERDAFERSLPPTIRDLARKVAFFQIPATLPGRAKEMREAVLSAASIINPSYSHISYEVAKDFAKGNPVKARDAINNALADVSRAFDASENFERTRFPWVNEGIAWFYTQGGSEDEVRLRSILENLATEFAMAQKNGLAPHKEEIEKMYRRFTTAMNPEQLKAILEEEIVATGNRMVTLEERWRQTFGGDPPGWTNKQTVKAAKKHGYYDLLADTGVFLGKDEKRDASGGGTEGEECPPAPDGSPCGRRKTIGGRLSEWDGKGWRALSPQESVAPGTGPLAQPEAQPFSLESILGGS